MEVGLVRKIDIDSEMQQAYLDYAMSVIVARALPDARDGLKPVHRRILYAMHDMGLRTDSSYKKSARIVGEVLGKYHPHGDAAVYDSMARMAQDFSMRYLLVDGQGNFGSVDGDPPAAMRYTEARMHALAGNMLEDIQKNTVDFDENFDGTLKEPSVLPAAIPNLLVNGATGIAVGMSTSIPPHNLSEVIGALQFMLEKWDKLDDINLEDLMGFIQGPDFPTGGIIIHDPEGDSLASAYGSGRGRVTVQARAHLEEMDRGRNRIIVTELPYMTNKSSLIERIASLVREERLDGIADLRDESDRQGMRIVIELSRGIDPEVVLQNLYKSTPMQSTFSIIMLALVEGEPRLLSLKQALKVYLEHRLVVVRRRSEYDLEKARQRAHILEGLRVALKNLDEVISIIRKAPDAETARERLMKRFKLTEIQAQAILDMQLRRLASLERKKIEDEYKEVTALIKSLEDLLRSPKKMRGVISEELANVNTVYGDRRRTQIVGLQAGEKKISLLTASDLTPEQTVWVSVNSDGLISRSADASLPRLSGNTAPLLLVQANTRDTLYLVCEEGEAAAIPMHAVPETVSPSDGIPFHKISPLREGQQLVGVFSLARGERPEDWYIVSVTRQGMVKKSPLSELPGASANTFTLVRVNEGDRLGWLRISRGNQEILMASAMGMAIRFKEEEVRPMGLVAAGVMGIKLQAGDEVSGFDLLPQPGEVFLVASDGSAKRVAISDFPLQGRYGQGVISWKLPDAVRIVGMAAGKGNTRVTLHLDKLAPKFVRLDEAPLVSRSARGGTVQALKKGDQITALTAPWEPPRPGQSGATPPKTPDTGGGNENGTGRKTTRKSGGGSSRKSASGKQPARKPPQAKSGEQNGGARLESEPKFSAARTGRKTTSAKSGAAKTEKSTPKKEAAAAAPKKATRSQKTKAGASTQGAAEPTTGKTAKKTAKKAVKGTDTPKVKKDASETRASTEAKSGRTKKAATDTKTSKTTKSPKSAETPVKPATTSRKTKSTTTSKKKTAAKPS